MKYQRYPNCSYERLHTYFLTKGRDEAHAVQGAKNVADYLERVSKGTVKTDCEDLEAISLFSENEYEMFIENVTVVKPRTPSAETIEKRKAKDLEKLAKKYGSAFVEVQAYANTENNSAY